MNCFMICYMLCYVCIQSIYILWTVGIGGCTVQREKLQLNSVYTFANYCAISGGFWGVSLFFFEEPGMCTIISVEPRFFWLFNLIRNGCLESQDPPALKPNNSYWSAAKNKMFSNPPHPQEPSQTSQPPALRISAADAILLVFLVWKMSHVITDGKQKAVGELKLLQSCCCMKQWWVTVTTRDSWCHKTFRQDRSCHSRVSLHLHDCTCLGFSCWEI